MLLRNFRHGVTFLRSQMFFKKHVTPPAPEQSDKAQPGYEIALFDIGMECCGDDVFGNGDAIRESGHGCIQHRTEDVQ
jgi:hypothetical protein